jgi:adenine phosphoribosyltransferase
MGHQMDRELERLGGLVRTIPNFPKPGILFRDVTTLLRDPWGLATTLARLTNHFANKQIDRVVAIESRGFVLGGHIARELGAGLVLARKRGKLPGAVEEVEYQLEYGSDCIQMHADALEPGDRCLIIDDLLATGGTCAATIELVEKCGGLIAGCGFIINLPDLKGHERLGQHDPFWLIEYPGH